MYRFFEVFKTLKLPEDLAVYFENVEVTKVSKTSTNSLARVYIKSDRVIEKPIIFKVEERNRYSVYPTWTCGLSTDMFCQHSIRHRL